MKQEMKPATPNAIEPNKLSGAILESLNAWMELLPAKNHEEVNMVDFENFQNNLEGGNCFGRLEESARRLGLEQALSNVLERYRDTFRHAREILEDKNRNYIPSQELKKVAQEYRGFFMATKVLFEDFKK